MRLGNEFKQDDEGFLVKTMATAPRVVCVEHELTKLGIPVKGELLEETNWLPRKVSFTFDVGQILDVTSISFEKADCSLVTFKSGEKALLYAEEEKIFDLLDKHYRNVAKMENMKLELQLGQRKQRRGYRGNNRNRRYRG